MRGAGKQFVGKLIFWEHGTYILPRHSVHAIYAYRWFGGVNVDIHGIHGVSGLCW